MKRLPLIVFMAILSILLAAGCSYSTANLQDVKVCSETDSDDLCETDESTFEADTGEIFVTGNLENAPEDTELIITWTYIGEEGDDPEEIDEVRLTSENTSNTFYSSLEAPPGGWPAGDYEVVLDLGTDNSDPVTKKFTVEGDARRQPADDIISDLKVCDDIDPEVGCSEDTRTFAPETATIYLTGMLGKVPPGTEITITWRYLGGEGGEEQDIDSIVLTATEDTPTPFTSNFDAVTDWPVGEYEIVIEVDGSKEGAKEFSVE